MAEEQGALLRKGIGDIFINLARRNQTLLDRQIEFIDQLEANEEDPDQLDNLFKLDHLATRMRRNAESLLVLAGAEPPRRRGRPVALADVVRVAIGEVEDFARISLLALDDVTVGGNVAVDLAHLLSELMENATHFSPPDTTVEIVGHRADDGYTLSVSDQGIGMSADQLAEANTQLARPPLVGLALSRSLGFIVIGRLASRFGVARQADLVAVGWRDRPGHPAARPRHRRRPADGRPAGTPGGRSRPPPRLRRSVAVDEAHRRCVRARHRSWSTPSTDAAVAADAAAGVELELDEFADTLDRADFEAEAAPPRLADAATRPTADLPRRPARGAGHPTSTPSPRATSSSVACSRWSATSSPPARSRAPPASSRPSPPTSGLSDADSVPGAFGGPAVLDEPPAVAGRGPPRPRPTRPRWSPPSATATEAKADGSRRSPPPAWCERTPKKTLRRRRRRWDAHHGRPHDRQRQPALARRSAQDAVPLPLWPQ